MRLVERTVEMLVASMVRCSVVVMVLATVVMKGEKLVCDLDEKTDYM